MTNEEKIKSLSTRELAKRLIWETRSRSHGADDVFWYSPSGYFSWFKNEAVEDCIKWLKEEAKPTNEEKLKSLSTEELAAALAGFSSYWVGDEEFYFGAFVSNLDDEQESQKEWLKWLRKQEGVREKRLKSLPTEKLALKLADIMQYCTFEECGTEYRSPYAYDLSLKESREAWLDWLKEEFK